MAEAFLMGQNSGNSGMKELIQEVPASYTYNIEENLIKEHLISNLPFSVDYSKYSSGSAIVIQNLWTYHKANYTDIPYVCVRLNIHLDQTGDRSCFYINQKTGVNTYGTISKGDNIIYLVLDKSDLTENESYPLYCYFDGDQYGNTRTISGTINSIDIIFPDAWVSNYNFNTNIGPTSTGTLFTLAEDGYYWCCLNFREQTINSYDYASTSIYIQIDDTNILGVPKEKAILYLNKGTHYVKTGVITKAPDFTILFNKINLIPSEEKIKALPNSIKKVHQKQIGVKTIGESGTYRKTSNNFCYHFEEYPSIIPYDKIIDTNGIHDRLVTGEAYDLGDSEIRLLTLSYSFIELN